MKNKSLVIGLILLFAVVLTTSVRSVNSTKPVLQKAPLTKTLFARGETLYTQNCASCHGAKGDAKSPAAYLLYPKPRDFTQGLFKLISTNSQQPSNQDLYNVITKGMPGSAMPSWDTLSREDRWALVYYVRYLTEMGTHVRDGSQPEGQINQGMRWSRQRELAGVDIPEKDVIRVPPETASTKEGVLRGKVLYAQACASCHGPQGKGDGPQVMRDSQGLPVKPRDLTAGIFKGSSSSEDLWYRVNAGLPGSPMPGYQGAYSDEQVWDLIHYIQTLPKKGAEERARLKRNRIVARRTEGKLESDPLSNQWKEIAPVFVSLTPLWWRDDRVEGVQVRALHNGSQLAIHLSWPQGKASDSAAAPQLFPDGAAIQFSTDPNPPFFAMGEKGRPIVLWHWKASWQKDLVQRGDIETAYPNAATDWYQAQKDYKHGSPFETKTSSAAAHDPRYLTGWGAGNPMSDPNRTTSAEEARSAGFGSVTSNKIDREPVQANGVWKDGEWHVVFIRDLKVEGKERLQFKPGGKIHTAFAVFDGSHKDRNGQKMVSIWNELDLQEAP